MHSICLSFCATSLFHYVCPFTLTQSRIFKLKPFSKQNICQHFNSLSPDPSLVPLTFPSATVALPCICATSTPSSSSWSLNISIWPCHLHFYLRFLHRQHFCISPIFFIYAKVVADTVFVSSEVYVPLCWLFGSLGAVFHPCAPWWTLELLRGFVRRSHFKVFNESVIPGQCFNMNWMMRLSFHEL